MRRDADGMRSFTIKLGFAGVKSSLLPVPLDLVVRFVSVGWALLACGESEEQTSPIRAFTVDDMSVVLPDVAISSLITLMRLADPGVVVPLGRLRAFSTPAIADMRGACVRPRRFRRASRAACTRGLCELSRPLTCLVDLGVVPVFCSSGTASSSMPVIALL